MIEEILDYDAEHVAVLNLDNILKMQLKSGLLLGTGFWFPQRIVMLILVIAAVVFTPVMLYHMIAARWIKSIVVFGLFVLVPYIASYLVPGDQMMLQFLLRAGAIVVYYIFVLSMTYFTKEFLDKARHMRLAEKESKLEY